MYVYCNLDNNIKYIFLAKFAWLILMLMTIIYSAIILSLSNQIGHFLIFLAPTIVINTISLTFTIVDLGTMLRDNQREKDAWFFDFIYGFFAATIPGNYYLYWGLGLYKFVIWEFLIILLFTIGYTIVIVHLVINGSIVLFRYLIATKLAIESRENKYEQLDNSIELEE